MKTWTDVAFEYLTNNAAPVCPECGSARVKISKGEMGSRFYVDVFCEDCESGDHFDGIKEN